MLRDIVSGNELPVPVLALAADGSLRCFNAAAKDEFGLTEASIGIDWVESRVPPRDRARVRKDIERVLRSGIGRRTTNRVHANGTDLQVRWQAFAVAADDVCVVAIGMPIQQEFHPALGILHDVNNLMSAAIMALALAKQDTERERWTEYAETALAEAADLSASYLRTERSLAQTAREHSTEHDLQALRPTLDAVARRATLAMKVHEGIQIALPPIDLSRIILNLVQNAARATSFNGHISVAVHQREPDGPIFLKVGDDGVGMDSDALRRFDETWASGTDGVGLGLGVVRAILDEHGGSLRVESRPDEGTTVTIELLPAIDGP